MRGRYGVAARVVIAAAGLAAMIATPAQAAGARQSAAHALPPARPAIVAPHFAGPRTAAQARTAAATCARYATQAGWANNGYYSGDLVTATAVCVAESAGDARRYGCNPSGKSGDYPPVSCPGGTTSYDRGLWQLNSKVQHAPPDTCAFDPVCNANWAYFDSQYGTSFSPWLSYRLDLYAKFIDVSQGVISSLRTGTVTSALLGECLARATRSSGAAVVLGNCGTGFMSQQWSTAGGTIRSGSLCAAVTASNGVLMSRCNGSAAQAWHLYGQDELRNARTGRCLIDPGGSLVKGTRVMVTRCANAKDQTWWLP